MTTKELIKRELSLIEMVQMHRNNVRNAFYFIQQRHGRESLDVGNITKELYRIELDHWRSLFMWALTVSKKDRAEIKARAYARFLNDGMHVANYFSEDGNTPGMWSAETEEDFRALCKEAFLEPDKVLEEHKKKD